MKLRSLLIAAAAVLVGVPAAIVATVAVTYSLHNEITGALRYGNEERHYLLHVPANLARQAGAAGGEPAWRDGVAIAAARHHGLEPPGR